MQPAVLLDIDGTLLDTNYLHALAWHRAFAEIGHDVPTASIHHRIGMGSEMLVKDLLGEENEAVVDGWRRYFDELKPEIRPCPGASDLLWELHRRGATVVLASSAEEKDLEAFLDVLDADGAIDEVVSAADVEKAKPSPEVLDVAMRKVSVAPDRAILVGDSVWDVEAAKRAGLACICVLTGGIGRCQLEEAGAVAVFRDPADLLAQLDGSPLGTLLSS